jgi:hypothetical protein
MSNKAFGDSIPTGAGASSSASGFIGLLNTALGVAFDNAAVSTAMAIDQTAALFQRNTVSGDKSIIMFGTNDQAKYDADITKRGWFIDAIRSYALWLGAECKLANAANGVTFAGSWSNGFALGIYGATSAGSTATFTSNGDKVAIGTLRQYNNTSTFTVKVDGVVKGNYSTGGDVRTLLGSAWGTSSILLTGLGSGSHTVEISATSANASNPVYFHWTSNVTLKARVLINNIPHAVNYTYGGSAANVDSYNAALNTLGMQLQALGLDVKVVDICSILTNADMADNVHPNDSGHLKIKNADLVVINGGVVSPPAISYSQTNIYKGSDGFIYAGDNTSNLIKLNTAA